jgi:hypothetical protein
MIMRRNRRRPATSRGNGLQSSRNIAIGRAPAAIDRFEERTCRRYFKAFHYEQARSFKAHLMAERNPAPSSHCQLRPDQPSG